MRLVRVGRDGNGYVFVRLSAVAGKFVTCCVAGHCQIIGHVAILKGCVQAGGNRSRRCGRIGGTVDQGQGVGACIVRLNLVILAPDVVLTDVCHHILNAVLVGIVGDVALRIRLCGCLEDVHILHGKGKVEVILEVGVTVLGDRLKRCGECGAYKVVSVVLSCNAAAAFGRCKVSAGKARILIEVDNHILLGSRGHGYVVYQEVALHCGRCMATGSAAVPVTNVELVRQKAVLHVLVNNREAVRTVDVKLNKTRGNVEHCLHGKPVAQGCTLIEVVGVLRPHSLVGTVNGKRLTCVTVYMYVNVPTVYVELCDVNTLLGALPGKLNNSAVGRILGKEVIYREIYLFVTGIGNRGVLYKGLDTDVRTLDYRILYVGVDDVDSA